MKDLKRFEALKVREPFGCQPQEGCVSRPEVDIQMVS